MTKSSVQLQTIVMSSDFSVSFLFYSDFSVKYFGELKTIIIIVWFKNFWFWKGKQLIQSRCQTTITSQSPPYEY